MLNAIVKLVTKGAALCVVAVVLSGCGLMNNGVLKESFWASSPFKQNDEAELGIAELAKGNYVTAEGHFQRALNANKRDIDALLGSGILYQNTGQFVKSREMYEAVLALRPDDSQQFVVWSQLTTRPASQVASVNLAQLESANATTQASADMPSAHSSSVTSGPVQVSGAPTSDVMLGRTRPQVASAPQAATQPTSMSPMAPDGINSLEAIGSFVGGDANVISRFVTAKALRDQGLITEEEFAQRRRSNIGALLPLTSPPPAVGLDRPVPNTEQISARLRAIGRALEMRAISVAQHASERNMILDALMPSAPVMVASPGVPPRGLMEAADSMRRVEKLRDAGYITNEEYARERQAIELSVQTASAAPNAAGASAAPTPAAPKEMAKEEKPEMSGPQPAVHLASYRSAKQAESGWLQIKRAHGAVLGDIGHGVSRVTLGSKGTYYRLKAGPLKSTADAKSLCSKLKQRRQFCDATVMNDG